MEYTTILYLSLSLLFIVLALKSLLQSTKTRENVPPSPPSLPILGHLHLVKHPMHRALHKLSQKYGPTMSLRFGSRPVVIVSSLSAAEECFTKNDIIFANRPKILLGKHLGYNYTTLLHAPYGDHWRNLRRIAATEVLSSNRLNMFLSIRREEIKGLLNKLSCGSRQEFSKVQLKTMFSDLSFNIIMRMVAGKRYYGDEVEDEEEARRFRNTMKEAIATGGLANPRDFLPILNWIDGGDFQRRASRLIY